LGKNGQEPHREIQEKWAKCEKSWVKINKAMKDIRLPEFGMPDDFVDLHDIVKSHTEQDSSWVEEIAKVTDTMPRSGATVYGTPNQSSGYVAIVKCQYSQVSGTCGRDKRDSLGPDGTT
jgi:hypothetical protein